MLDKPRSCQGCPFYGDRKGFVPDEIVPGAKTFILMQNPGSDEEMAGVPAVGKAGQSLNTTFIPLAGLTRGQDVSVGNVLKCRWTHPKTKAKTNDLPSKTGAFDAKGKLTTKEGNRVLTQAIKHCMDHHFRLPDEVTHLIALGDIALMATGQTVSLSKWRGFELQPFQGRKVFGTFHPVYTFHQPVMTIPVMMDWKKIKRWLRGEWPKAVTTLPLRFQGQEWSEAFFRPHSQTAFITIDTEYNTNTHYPYIIGIAYWSQGAEPLGGIQIVGSESIIASAKKIVYKLITAFPVVFHNALVDLRALEVAYGFTREDYKMGIEDTLQMHALLQPEWPHTLEFLESLYSPYNKLKHLQESHELLYNWGDCLTTGYVYGALKQSMQADHQTAKVYTDQNVPLVWVRLDARKTPIFLDRVELAAFANRYREMMVTAQEVAEACLGFPINVGSQDAVTAFLEAEGIKLPKHQKTGQETIAKDALADLRRQFLDFDPQAEKDGITVEMLERYLQEGGHPLLECRAMYQKAAQLFNHFLKPLLKQQHVDQTQTIIEPDDFVECVIPDQETHTQASGRWSIKNPPISTYPPKLRKVLLPPPGYAMVKYDADQQELRLQAHIAHDEPTLAIFEKGWDIHTLNCCDLFAYPSPPDKANPHKSMAPEAVQWRESLRWEGKDDKRRVFSKGFIYRLIYRGKPSKAMDLPFAKVLGLNPKRLTEVANNYLAKHPAIPKFWAQTDEIICKTRTVRSWYGRKRFLNGSLEKTPHSLPAIYREGTNHIIQSGGVDWHNLLLLTILKECHDLGVKWAFGAHDSHTWFIPEHNVSVFLDRLKEIIWRPWQINNRPLVIPVEFSPVIINRGGRSDVYRG
jgi:DNA polymerase I-like protein with 3'-5' exonuclease and polymerase domains/uracil-DNA glycosylase